MGPSRASAAVFVLFVASNLAIGNRYPFYTFDMYAQLQHYTESAVLVFRADGAEVQLEMFKDFAGPELFVLKNPQGIPYSMGWRTFESRRYMELHAAPPEAPPGPVQFEAGFIVVRIGPEGPEEVRPFQALARGTAWPR